MLSLKARKRKLEKSRQWWKAHPDYRKSLHHKNYRKEWMRKWRKTHKVQNQSSAKKRAYNRKWWAKQAVVKSNQWISKSLRTRVYLALKGLRKFYHFSDLLGCSVEQFRRHIETQFKPGMTFENYGKWHIDHVVPCARFDLNSPEQQRHCFHYSNLQPLWAKENISKGATLAENLSAQNTA